MTTKQDHSGYTPWEGGIYPFSRYDRVSVQLRSGRFDSGFAKDFKWYQTGAEDDIMAYAIIPPRAPESPFDKQYHDPNTIECLVQQIYGLTERVSKLEAERVGGE